jgi:recombinational DNA repair protein (RecF pathway)
LQNTICPKGYAFWTNTNTCLADDIYSIYNVDTYKYIRKVCQELKQPIEITIRKNIAVWGNKIHKDLSSVYVLPQYKNKVNKLITYITDRYIDEVYSEFKCFHSFTSQKEINKIVRKYITEYFKGE